MAEARITIDSESTVPVRRQIIERIRDVIVDGALGSGDELPSVRRLALDLGVHFNTVAEAYRSLAEDGWIKIEQGRRARVAERAKQTAPTPATVNHFRLRLKQLVAEMRSRGFSSSKIARELAALSAGLR